MEINMIEEKIGILLKEIKWQRDRICSQVGKYPNEIKMNCETLDMFRQSMKYYITYNIGRNEILGMKIFIDTTLEDLDIELTFSNILEIL